MAFEKSQKEKLPSAREVFEHIASHSVQSLYLFFGEEDFLIDECVEALISALVPQEMRAFNVDVVDAEKVTAKDLLSLASAYPMMNERRVVVVRDFGKLTSTEKGREILSSYISQPPETTCFIMVCGKKPDFRMKPYGDLKRRNLVYEFPRLYENQVPSWIETRCKQAGKYIDAEAIQLLVSIVGSSLRSLHNELEKVFTFIGEKERITENDISKVVGFVKGTTIFDLQNALGKQDAANAFNILHRMLDAGESPQGMIVMLTRYLFTLMKVKELRLAGKTDGELATELKVPQFFLKDYTTPAERLSFCELERSLVHLRDADLQLKTSAADASHVMEMLVYSLLHPLHEKES